MLPRYVKACWTSLVYIRAHSYRLNTSLNSDKPAML